MSAPPDPGTPDVTFRGHGPANGLDDWDFDTIPPPHDVALWQPKRLASAPNLAWAAPLADPSPSLAVRLDDFWGGAS